MTLKVKNSATVLRIEIALRYFSIPINEGKDDNNNQIDEYLDEYNGPGVQHLAFLTDDLVGSLDKLDKSTIATLDIVDHYYDTIFDRVPWVKEDKDKIKEHQILVDSQSENCYLLQIFTRTYSVYLY